MGYNKVLQRVMVLCGTAYHTIKVTNPREVLMHLTLAAHCIAIDMKLTKR